MGLVPLRCTVQGQNVWIDSACCVVWCGVQVYAQAKHGADWWAANLFRHKTYVEARSVANPFIAFWRVYAFHAVLLTAMASLVSPGSKHVAVGDA